MNVHLNLHHEFSDPLCLKKQGSTGNEATHQHLISIPS